MVGLQEAGKLETGNNTALGNVPGAVLLGWLVVVLSVARQEPGQWPRQEAGPHCFVFLLSIIGTHFPSGPCISIRKV
jgi:hypothetical protein